MPVYKINNEMLQLTLFLRSFLDFLAGRKMVGQVLDLAPPVGVLKSPNKIRTSFFALFVCASLPQFQCPEQRSPSLLQDQNTACTRSQRSHPTQAPSAQSFCAPEPTAKVYARKNSGQNHLARHLIEEQLPGLV